jgi:gas vesicle protein
MGEEKPMSEKDKKPNKDIFAEIGDAFKQLGEEIKPHLFKAEGKLRDFDDAIRPTLSNLGQKMKELGDAVEGPMDELSARLKKWSDSVKPVVKDMGDRVKAWKKSDDSEPEEVSNELTKDE